MSVLMARLMYHQSHNCFGYLVSDPRHNNTNALREQCSNGLLMGTFRVYDKCMQCEAIVIHLYSTLSDQAYPSHSDSVLLLNEQLAFVARLVENDFVVLEKVNGTEVCSHVELEARSLDDWNIVQKYPAEFEAVILKQIQVVCKGMSFPVWITKNTMCMFRVVSVSPQLSTNDYVLLREDTELHIQPYSTESTHSNSDSAHSDSHNESGFDFTTKCSQFISRFFYTDNSVHNSSVDDNLIINENLVNTRLRILPESLIDQKDVYRSMHPTSIITFNNGTANHSSPLSIVRISSEHSPDPIFSLLITLPEYLSSDSQPFTDILRKYTPHCIISPILCSEYGLAEYTWITCRSVHKSQMRRLKHLEVTVDKQFEHRIVAELNAYFSKHCERYPVVLSQRGITLKLAIDNGQSHAKCVIKPSKTDLSSCTESNANEFCFVFTCDRLPTFDVLTTDGDATLNSQQIETDSSRKAVTVSEAYTSAQQNIKCFGESFKKIAPLRYQVQFVTPLVEYIEYCLNAMQNISPGNILITGNESSGKTTIVDLLARSLINHSTMVIFSVYIECKRWKGKSVEIIEKQLTSTVEQLKRRKPCVLILDNIDFCSTTAKNDDQRNLHLERTFTMIRCVSGRSNILVIATAKSSRSVHKSLLNTNGRRFFARIDQINALNEVDRSEALKVFCYSEALKCCCDLEEFRMKTENFVIGDLKKLSQRIILETLSTDSECIRSECVERALRDFRNISSKIEKPNNAIKVQWNDVGGMHNVKKLLEEVFVWPIKYSALFRNCAIRPGRGVLLYGASGCGKTLIARALASECHLNIIYIKGPELLSKYIGQSEENVRNVFERGRSSKPCLIFFDEFDSLGTKRGHDNTGVTDRIVNQLLTELDGVDSSNDVFVLAATNRIDLIDEALLRPGRFDYMIECKLPNVEERLSILQVLCRNVKLDSTINLRNIAEATSDYSGADLKGLVTNAQFNAMRHSVKSYKQSASNEDETMPNDEEYLIRSEHMESALIESSKKIQKRKRKNSLKPKRETGQRVTLA